MLAAARAGQTPSAVPCTGGGIPDLGGLAGLGLQDLGMMGGAGGLMDPGFIAANASESSNAADDARNFVQSSLYESGKFSLPFDIY